MTTLAIRDYQQQQELNLFRANIHQLEQEIVIDPDTGVLYSDTTRKRVLKEAQEELEKLYQKAQDEK